MRGRDTSLHRFSTPTTKLDVVSPDGQYATLETDEGVVLYQTSQASGSRRRARPRAPQLPPAGTVSERQLVGWA